MRYSSAIIAAMAAPWLACPSVGLASSIYAQGPVSISEAVATAANQRKENTPFMHPMPGIANKQSQLYTPVTTARPRLIGMMEISSVLSSLMTASQSIVHQVEDIGSHGIEQLDNIVLIIDSRAQSLAHVIAGNQLANQLLFPLTNYPDFKGDAQKAIESFQSLVIADIGYAKDQLKQFTSIVIQDVTTLTADIRKLLTSLYSFSQEAVDIILTSPLLTALILINPAFVIATMLAVADPIQLLTNYPSWKEQFGARQSSMMSNYKDIYSFVSTGLPMLESGVLGILGGISNIGRLAESENNSAMQSELDNMIRAYTALSSLAADKRHIPLLASAIEPQDAWMSVAYHRLSLTPAGSAVESAVDVAPTPTKHAANAVETAPYSPIPTLHLS